MGEDVRFLRLGQSEEGGGSERGSRARVFLREGEKAGEGGSEGSVWVECAGVLDHKYCFVVKTEGKRLCGER